MAQPFKSRNKSPSRLDCPTVDHSSVASNVSVADPTALIGSASSRSLLVEMDFIFHVQILTQA